VPSLRIRVVVAKTILPVLGLALVVAGWWWYTAAFDVRAIILPAPPDVGRALVDEFPRLVTQARVTITQSATGFGLAAVVGLVAGTAIAHSQVVNYMTYPWLIAFNAVPKVALAPLLVVWLGFGMPPRIALAFLVCFFPVVLATVTGLRATPAELVELARSLDGSALQMFVKVRFPYALPQVFIGLKVALPLSIIGSVIGEFQAGSTGLGFVIKLAATDKALAFAALVMLAAMSIAMFFVLVGIERLLLPWVRATTSPAP
jgi:NitT/TauT family transport system permease protein